MKKVLSLLLAYIFLQTQSWALSGGPRYSGASEVNPIGTYSGVLTGPLNALGVFTVGVPSIGVATGEFVAFAEGSYYTGTLQGIADPAEGTLQAVVEGQRYRLLFSSTSSSGNQSLTFQIDATADGFLKARIRDSGRSSGGLASTRLDGTATLEVKERRGGNFERVGEPLSFVVDGFKQSSTPPSQSGNLGGRGGRAGRGGP